MRSRLEVFDHISEFEGAPPLILKSGQRIRAVLEDGHVIEFALDPHDDNAVEVRGSGNRSTRLRIEPNVSNSIRVSGVPS